MVFLGFVSGASPGLSEGLLFDGNVELHFRPREQNL